MKKFRTILALVLALMLCVALFAGCTAKPADDGAADDSAATDDAATDDAATDDVATDDAADAADDSASEGDSDVHEVYKLIDEGAIRFSGIYSPNTPSRKDVEKAWPVENSDGVVTIGWSEQNADNDWFIAVGLAAKALCEEYGFELNYMVCDNDYTKQSQQIDTFISLGVDIIVVDPLNQSSVVEDVNRAVDAGIPVVCIGTVPNECNCLTTITFSMFKCGWVSGVYMGSQFAADEDINCALIPGLMGNTTSESRLTGAIAGILYTRMEALGTPYECEEDAWLDAYYVMEDVSASGKGACEKAGFNVVGYGEGNWTVNDGLAAAEDLVTANADILNLIIPDNDFMAVGAAQAVANAGLADQIKVGAAGADGTLEGVNAVKDGTILCTGTMSGAQVGAGVVYFLNDIFNNGFDPTDLLMGSLFEPTAITAENCDQFANDNPDGWDGKFYATPEWTGVQTYTEWYESTH